MFGGRSNSIAANIPNFFPDLATNTNVSHPTTVKSKTLDAISKKNDKHRRSRSSSSSSSCDEDCSSHSSHSSYSSRQSVSVSPSRNHKKRPLESNSQDREDIVKRTKLIDTRKEVSEQLDTLSKNNLDLNRVIADRDALKRAYDTHGDKLKELSAMEEKVANKKGLLDRSTKMVEENMRHLAELEAKESKLLLRIDTLKKERASFEQKKLEWDAMREKIALSLGFTKKDL